jgi:hypothetical protein
MSESIVTDTSFKITRYVYVFRFTVFRLLTDFVCLYNYEFWLSLCKIVRSSVILLLPLLSKKGKSLLEKISIHFIAFHTYMYHKF